jgi:hypothetical protein
MAPPLLVDAAMPEKPIHPELAAVLSEIELSFFRRGEPDAPPVVETFDDLDEGYEPPRFWSRMFRQQRPATEPPLAILPAQAPPAPRMGASLRSAFAPGLPPPPAPPQDGDDEEWQWEIEIARARGATGG